MIFNMVGKAGGGSSGLPTFTYTGSYNLYDEGSGNWHLCLLSSGTLRFTKAPGSVDSFVVGGGGGGGTIASSYNGGCGGNGGCVYTGSAYSPADATDYAVVIGAGGEANTAGGDSSIFGLLAEGGNSYDTSKTARYAGSVPETAYTSKTQGGDGGYSGSANGEDGADGVYPFATSGMSGCNLKYGSSGGGSCGWNQSTSTTAGTGGAGAGSGATAQNGNGGNGAANQGAGGGGGASKTGTGGTGGSGIVILRNHRSA